MFLKVLRNQQGQLRNGWWIGIFFILLAAVLFPLIIYSKETGQELSPWLQAIVVLMVSLTCQRLRKRPQAELLGALDSRWLGQLFVGMALGCALMLLPALLLWGGGVLSWQHNGLETEVIWAAILLFVGVAVTEELTFRGFMFQRLIDGIGCWPAQLLMAGYFVLTHVAALKQGDQWNYLATLNIFIASLLFGLAFIRTQSLAMPIGLHFMANFTQGTLLGFGVSGSDQAGLVTPIFIEDAPSWLTGAQFGLEASLPGLLVLTLLTYGVWRWSGTARHP